MIDPEETNRTIEIKKEQATERKARERAERRESFIKAALTGVAANPNISGDGSTIGIRAIAAADLTLKQLAAEKEEEETPSPRQRISFYVNGVEYLSAKSAMHLYTYINIVAMAEKRPGPPYTVTYEGAAGDKPDGTMIEGDTVEVKEGTVFNVMLT